MINKKSVLFSPIGTSDPIRSQCDGPMLHIVRHIKPEAVWLFLTKEMAEYHKKDDRYRKSIQRVLPDCKIKIIETNIDDPSDFDACYRQFRDIIRKMRETYKDHEIYVNVSSGTTQMKNVLSYEAVAGTFGITAIQVKSPKNAANDNEEHLTSDFDIDLAFETNQDHNIPSLKSRLVIPDFKAITLYNLSFKIESMIKSYNYSGALELLKNNESLFDERLGIILKHGDLRTKLQYDKCFAIINNDKTKGYKDRIWFIHDRNAIKFYEFFMTMKLKQKRGELSEMILKLTPFSFELALYYLRDIIKFDLEKICRVSKNSNQYKLQRSLISEYDSGLLNHLDAQYKPAFIDCDLSLDNIVHILIYINSDQDIYNKFVVLREVESLIRNKVAHQMIPVSEEIIKGLMKSREKDKCLVLPKSTSNIIYLCGSLLKLIFKNRIQVDNFVYDEINKIIKELLV
ncbi:MAG: hypothetical protein GX045_11435 [Clostridiaceae bacterium]|nr:hypothetical protein [Clostridiaceae bacterium]